MESVYEEIARVRAPIEEELQLPSLRISRIQASKENKNVGAHKGLIVKCPKCHENGFLTKRWTRNQYTPRISLSTDAIKNYFYYKDSNDEVPPAVLTMARRFMDEIRIWQKTKMLTNEKGQSRIKYLCIHDPDLDVYKIRPRFEHIGDSVTFDGAIKRIFEVVTRVEISYFVGHYNKEKYLKNMQRYKKGSLKCRPNGRKWCKIDNFIRRRANVTIEEIYKEYKV